jgi:hypothetical protein
VSVDGGSERSNADSSAKQAVGDGVAGEGIVVEIGRAQSPCSNVASEVERALAALGEGRVDLARKALLELLEALHAADRRE